MQSFKRFRLVSAKSLQSFIRMLPETPLTKLAVRQFSKVVLPAPLGPRIAVNFPDSAQPFKLSNITLRGIPENGILQLLIVLRSQLSFSCDDVDVDDDEFKQS